MSTGGQWSLPDRTVAGARSSSVVPGEKPQPFTMRSESCTAQKPQVVRLPDGTADIAVTAAGEARDHLTVLKGQPLPAGWTGKLWAQKQGVAAAPRGEPRLSAAHRCRHRLRAGCAARAWSRAPSKRLVPHLADGEAALREPGRARVRFRPSSSSSRCSTRSPG